MVICLADRPTDAHDAAASRLDPAARLTVRELVADGEHTLILTGELDLASRPKLDAALARVERQDAAALTVDLSGVEFMDSTGLHGLLAAKASCEQGGRRFMLVRGSAQVQRLFELSGLLDELPFGDSPAP